KGKSKNLFRKISEDFAVNVILGSVFGAVQRGIDIKMSEYEIKKEKERLFEFVLHGLFSGFDENSVLPLKNKTIVITRTVEQSKGSSAVVSEFRRKVLIFSTREIVPPQSLKQFDKNVKDNHRPDYIILTSAHAVKMFVERINQLNIC